MAMVKYKQCELKRKNVKLISWLPDRYAIVGKFIKLTNENGEQEDGWEVKSVGTTVLSADDANLFSSEHTRHRKETDI